MALMIAGAIMIVVFTVYTIRNMIKNNSDKNKQKDDKNDEN